MARIAKFRHGHLLAVELALLDDSAFDGHSVVIPTGTIACTEAVHGFVLVYEVLEYLVHCGTHVNISVREGRSVVKNEARLVRVSLQHLLINALILPCLLHLGLALRQICAHGEVGLR